MAAQSSTSTTNARTQSATLLVHCPDQVGLVATFTDFLRKNNGNILVLDQHVDPEEKVFFMRVEWDLGGFALKREEIGPALTKFIPPSISANWSIHFSNDRPRMALFVSKLSHCLYDILARVHSGEWAVDIPIIISNHPDLKPVADHFSIPFEVVPITPETKQAQEKAELEILKKHNVDFIVLARYMQVLSNTFVDQYTNRIINIHHSFLPAFPGARPYHSAHARGVKVIGATSHYVTEDLDQGPIIDQEVATVRHTDKVDDMIRKGRDLEKLVLAHAVWLHLQRRILVYRNRTIVFS